MFRRYLDVVVGYFEYMFFLDGEEFFVGVLFEMF